MASFKVYSASLVLILFVTSGAVKGIEDADDEIIKAKNCKTKMHWVCAKEIFTSIFQNGTLSNKCCGELKVMGKICHSAFVRSNLKAPKFQNVSKSAIVAKSVNIWNTCASLKTISPSPSTSAH